MSAGAECGMQALGIDIGGSGIKAAPVDISDGRLLKKRRRLDTPQPSTPARVIEVVARLVDKFDWRGPIGCTFPAVIRNGHTKSAANVDAAWLNFPAQAALAAGIGQQVALLNDADAAGLAERQYGAARGKMGTVLVFTLGTGLGSAMFRAGALVPNTELGHLTMYGDSAERYMTDSARKRENLSWQEWAARVNEYLALVDFLFSPDDYILGGGVSKKHAKFLPYLRANARISPAELRNDAGIVGAALHAVEQE